MSLEDKAIDIKFNGFRYVVSKPTWEGGKVVLLSDALDALERAESALREAREILELALKTASGRWCEWGSRAESTRDILEELEAALKSASGTGGTK